MTITTTDYFDISNSNARAIYGKYHPKDWHGVESYLRSNPDWEVELFQSTPEEIDTAITASRKLNKVLGQSPEKYSEITHTTQNAIDDYVSACSVNELHHLALQHVFELALFKTLVMPSAKDAAVIEAFCVWKAKQIADRASHDVIVPHGDDELDDILSGGQLESYFTKLCEPSMEPETLHPDYANTSNAINFDDLF